MLTHLQVTGHTPHIVFPKTLQEIAEAYLTAQQKGLQVFALGGGSNTLIVDAKDTLLISDRDLEKELIINDDGTIIASANTNINTLIIKAAREGFGGLDFLAGIPAHLGGIVFMNAGEGKSGLSISDFVEWVEVIGNSKFGMQIERMTREQIDFSYRKSNIDGFITKVALRLTQIDNRDEYLKTIKQAIEKRKQTQPLEYPNLGCFFKNPEPQHPTPNTQHLSAGALIDQAGLKGYKIGGACVSEKHANFLINTGNATVQDFLALIDHIKQNIKDKYNIELTEEVRIIND